MKSTRTEQKQERNVETIQFAEYRGQACLNMIEAKSWLEERYWMYLPSLSDELMRCVIVDFIKLIFRGDLLIENFEAVR